MPCGDAKNLTGSHPLKKPSAILFFIVAFVIFPLAKAESGTFFVGTKFWYTSWESGILDWIGKEISAQMNANNWNVISDAESGTGYLAGPLLGYQSTDGLWSVSLAPMVLSSFSQELDLMVEQIGFTFDTKVDTTRYDYDLAAAYSLARWNDMIPFLEYCRVFAGYKYQIVNMDIYVRASGGIPVDAQKTTFDYKVNMPTVGLGMTYPITHKIAAGVQGGVGIAFFDTPADTDSSTTLNAEASLSYVPIDKMIIQLGYRYQEWEYNPSAPEYPVDSSSKEINSGPIVTVVYTF